MTLSKIEKCAKLMGYEIDSLVDSGVWIIKQAKPLTRTGDLPLRLFNPLTNKSDLVDLMCAVEIGFDWFEEVIIAGVLESGCAAEVKIADHPDKQTALAHAVVDVACQIYDRQFGGE